MIETPYLSQSDPDFFSNLLEPDLTFQFLRLRISNVGSGIARPEVTVQQVIYDDWTSPPLASLPFEIHWSHLPENQRAELSNGDGGKTVGLIAIQHGLSPLSQRPLIWINIMGMNYKPAIDYDVPLENKRAVYIRVQAQEPGTNQIASRWFVLVPDAASELKFRCYCTEPPSGNS